MNQKKWLVTGAAGFLGSHVVEQLLNLQQLVAGVDDLSWGHEKNLEMLKNHKDGLFFKEDIRSTSGLEEIMESFNPHHIVHLAALHFIPDAVKNPTLAVDINVRGTQSLLQAARKCSYETLYFASTGDVYEKSDLDNNEELTKAEPYNIYGLTKHIGEQLVRLEHQNAPKKKFIVGRIYNLIGPRETNPHIIPEIMKQLKTNPKQVSLGNIWPVRDYVPVDECARAIIELNQKAERNYGCYNVATGHGQSVEDLIRTMEKILGHAIRVERDESKVRTVERKRLVADVTRLKKHLGWAPTSQVEAILKKLLRAEGLYS